MLKLITIMVLVLCTSLSRAAVVEVSDNGFTIEIINLVNSDSKTAYAQFIRVSDYWDPDHTWFGDASALFIEEKAGGCFCEVNGERSALHMRVDYVDPGREMRLTGALGPLKNLGLQGVMSFKFENSGQDTRITHTYQVRGQLDKGFESLAEAVDSVQSGQLSRLSALLPIASPNRTTLQ